MTTHDDFLQKQIAAQLREAKYEEADGAYPGGGGAMGVYVNSTISVASGKGANGYIIVEEYS